MLIGWMEVKHICYEVKKPHDKKILFMSTEQMSYLGITDMGKKLYYINALSMKICIENIKNLSIDRFINAIYDFGRFNGAHPELNKQAT